MGKNNGMALTEAVRQHLQAERERLQDAQKQRREEIDRLIAEDRALADAIGQIDRLLKLGSEVPAQDGQTGGTAFQQLGFREAIRTVLREARRGMKPAEVTDELRRRGWESDAAQKTSLSTRVSNDLFRMKRAGKVRKKGPRYYAKEADDKD